MFEYLHLDICNNDLKSARREGSKILKALGACPSKVRHFEI